MEKVYRILTDSSCDLSEEMVQKLGVRVVPLHVHFRGQEYSNYPEGSPKTELQMGEFYDALRSGEMAKTTAANPEHWGSAIRSIFEAGEDVLLLAFSSGLSSTYAAAKLAGQELSEEFPDRKIRVVDTLCASLGQGLLIYHAAMRQKAGVSLEDNAKWVEDHRLELCHWFTVEDLMFLKRGGRVSAATAVVGTMLQIKPVMHVDNEGHLINMAKARGRKASIDALMDHMKKTGFDLSK